MDKKSEISKKDEMEKNGEIKMDVGNQATEERDYSVGEENHEENVAAGGERELERLKGELRASNAHELQLETSLSACQQTLVLQRSKLEMLTRIEGWLGKLNLKLKDR